MTDTLKYTERDMVTALRSAAALARCQGIHVLNTVIHASGAFTVVPCQECIDVSERLYPMPKRMIPNVLDDPCDFTYHFRVDPDSMAHELQYKRQIDGEDEWSMVDRFNPFPERIRVWYELLKHPMVEEP